MSSRPNAPDDTNTKMMTTTVASRSRTLRSWFSMHPPGAAGLVGPGRRHARIRGRRAPVPGARRPLSLSQTGSSSSAGRSTTPHGVPCSVIRARNGAGSICSGAKTPVPRDQALGEHDPGAGGRHAGLPAGALHAVLLVGLVVRGDLVHVAAHALAADRPLGKGADAHRAVHLADQVDRLRQPRHQQVERPEAGAPELDLLVVGEPQPAPGQQQVRPVGVERDEEVRVPAGPCRRRRAA